MRSRLCVVDWILLEPMLITGLTHILPGCGDDTHFQTAVSPSESHTKTDCATEDTEGEYSTHGRPPSTENTPKQSSTGPGCREDCGVANRLVKNGSKGLSVKECFSSGACPFQSGMHKFATVIDFRFGPFTHSHSTSH